jgi:hydroxymethylglutaryl-CoA lyase
MKGLIFMNYPEKITLCEVGLRDGLQNEKKILPTADKLRLLGDLVDAGYRVIEVGSFVSPKAVPQMADTDELFRAFPRPDAVEFRALIANFRGLERAGQCGCQKVKLNVSASRGHNLANLNMTPEQSVAGFDDCVKGALDLGIAISGSISMPFGSPWEGKIPYEDVCSIIEAYLNVGINEISLSDASGMAYPSQVFELCTLVLQKYPDVVWWLHFHNTRGLGIANILAGMQAGVSRFDVSFAGLGGCPFVPGAAGNVSSEDVLHMCSEMGIETGIDLDKAIRTGREVADLLDTRFGSYLLRAGKSSDLLNQNKK